MISGALLLSVALTGQFPGGFVPPKSTPQGVPPQATIQSYPASPQGFQGSYTQQAYSQVTYNAPAAPCAPCDQAVTYAAPVYAQTQVCAAPAGRVKGKFKQKVKLKGGGRRAARGGCGC